MQTETTALSILTELLNAVLQLQEHESNGKYGGQGEENSTVKFAV